MLKNDPLRSGPKTSIVLDKPMDLGKDDQYLALGVWDVASSRFGTIQIPIQVPKKINHTN
jgi:hypothetical protein